MNFLSHNAHGVEYYCRQKHQAQQSRDWGVTVMTSLLRECRAFDIGCRYVSRGYTCMLCFIYASYKIWKQNVYLYMVRLINIFINLDTWFQKPYSILYFWCLPQNHCNEKLNCCRGDIFPEEKPYLWVLKTTMLCLGI